MPKEVSGGQGKPKAPERWSASSGRGLEDEFQVEAFSYQVWSFSVLLWRELAKGNLVKSRASQKVRGGQGESRAPEWWSPTCFQHISNWFPAGFQ